VLGCVAVVLGVLIYMFAVVGIEIFQGSFTQTYGDLHANFDSFDKAILLAFQMVSGQMLNGACSSPLYSTHNTLVGGDILLVLYRTHFESLKWL
jgi:hypothetical protein